VILVLAVWSGFVDTHNIKRYMLAYGGFSIFAQESAKILRGDSESGWELYSKKLISNNCLTISANCFAISRNQK